jgi:DNA topoisomerase-1
MPGRYGPYVRWAKINATLPKDLSPETVTLEKALGLIAEKAATGGKARTPRKTAAKPAAKTAAPKTPAAKKPAAGKASAKKAAPKAARA